MFDLNTRLPLQAFQSSAAPMGYVLEKVKPSLGGGGFTDMSKRFKASAGVVLAARTPGQTPPDAQIQMPVGLGVLWQALPQ